MDEFDVVVIGAGPGGYPAAIKASQNGASVALIEKKQLGGTCLNRGCIPTKTLIAGADVLHIVKNASAFGIEVGEVTPIYSKMAARKDAVVKKIRTGLTGLIKSNKIKIFNGHGQFVGPHEVKVTGEDNAVLHAKKVIIATGSEPFEIPDFPFDYKKIHDSTSILELKELPDKIVIIGGGVIGCEFASLMIALGVEVVVIEALESIIPTESPKIQSALTRILSARGVEIQTDTVVESIDTSEDGVTVHLAGGHTIQSDISLVCVGRKLNSDALGLDTIGLNPTKRGGIETNDKMETSVPDVYAIGDVTNVSLLAHVATHQGLVAANNATGCEHRIHYNAIPNVIYTDPEIATVGLTLEQAIEQGVPATIGAFPFQALGKSQATAFVEGFAQIVTNKNTGEILGAQVMGHEAGTLIAEMTLALNNELTLDSVTETMHAHPTVTEAWLEAALHAKDTPLHLPPKRERA